MIDILGNAAAEASIASSPEQPGSGVEASRLDRVEPG
jgi:hypothetical protein